MAKRCKPLPKLEQQERIDRLLTAAEYYHACIGKNPRTLIKPRELVLVIEGKRTSEPIDWQGALDKVVAVNPGTRLRMTGKRQHTRWSSDGIPPQVRFVENCDWDGRSYEGSEFIYQTELSLEKGPTIELIIAGRQECKVIIRASHAVVDGAGSMHIAMELFRALRGEPLLGTNAHFTDVDLMKSVPSDAHRLKFISPAPLTGGVQGNARGGTWRRITVAGPLPNLLPRLALAVAEFARLHGDFPVRIAMPINLRRHADELHSTMNFTSMMFIDVQPADDVKTLKTRINDLLKRNIETNYVQILELIRYLPLSWLDRIVSDTEKSYLSPSLFETAVLSVFGGIKKNFVSCPGFIAETMYGLPQRENAMIGVGGFQGKYEICVGMSHVFASNGRLDAFMQFLQQRLTAARAASADQEA